MLKKLMKYEFRFYNKFCLIALLVMTGSVILSRISIELSDYVLTHFEMDALFYLLYECLSTLTFISVMGCVAALVIPQILAAIRFYRNLTRDEGYLSFTLPVKPSHHVLCKTLVPLIWSTILIFALVILVILVSIPGQVPESTLPENEADATLISTVLLFIFGGLTVVILSLLSSIVQIHFSIACGQLFRKHKLLGSIGCYLGLNTVLQFLSTGTMIFPFILVSSVDELTLNGYLLMIFGILSVILLVLIGVLYGITCRIMTNKLNLE